MKRTVRLFLVVWLAGCGSKQSRFVLIPQEADRIPGADVVIRGFTATGLSGGRKSWSLKATEAYMFQKSGETLVYQVELTSAGKTGPGKKVTETKVIADEGMMNSLTGDLSLKGNIRMSTSDGRYLETSEIYFDEESSEVYTDSPVRMRMEGGHSFRADGLRADTELKKITLKRGRGETWR